MISLGGQDECETLETFFGNVDLSFAEKLVCECFHTCGPGRPPRNPHGVFRAFIVMCMKGVRSLREMVRLLNVDCRLRRLCLIRKGERGYPRSVLSRFTRRVGAERLRRIIQEKVIMLLKRNRAWEVDALLDASFIKAWSTRHPKDSGKGYSDGEARVGRAGKTYGLGYKVHAACCTSSELPVAFTVASCNLNEKRFTKPLLKKLKGAGISFETVLADAQYDSSKVRETVREYGAEPVIP